MSEEEIVDAWRKVDVSEIQGAPAQFGKWGHYRPSRVYT